MAIVHGSMKWLVPGAMALSLGACMTEGTDDELGSTEQEVNAGKRTICHYNGQGVPHPITISENAVPAHFANHGDHDLRTFYADSDGDGFGAGAAIVTCTQPAGTSTNDDDCDDGNAATNPGAAEVCDDGIDNNCDGTNPTSVTYYRDADGDGYGAGETVVVCEGPQPPDTSTTNDDCNDTEVTINPGAAEVCGDNTDNDCDGAFAQAEAVFYLNGIGQQGGFPQGSCTIHQNITHTICRERPDQQILVSSTANGAGAAYFDELSVITVTSPAGVSSGRNDIWWEANCRNPAYPNVNHGAQPAVLDITSLFGAEYGQFEVNLQVRNAFQPYQWFTTWVVPVN